MRVLGTVVDQQQDFHSADRIGEQIQERLGFLVYPVQVLEDHHQRLIQRFTQQNTFDRVERASLANLRVHLRERALFLHLMQIFVETIERLLPLAVVLAVLGNSQQGEQVRNCVFQ